MKYLFDRQWSMYNEETACYDSTNVTELKKLATKFINYHKTENRYEDVSTFLIEAFGDSVQKDDYTINKLTRHELSWDETEEQARKGTPGPPQRELDYLRHIDIRARYCSCIESFIDQATSMANGSRGALSIIPKLGESNIFSGRH